MQRLLILFCCSLASSVLLAEPNPQLTPAQILDQMMPSDGQQVVLDLWQQSPAQLGVSHLSNRSGLNNGGDETELSVNLALNNPTNQRYLQQLQLDLNGRQQQSRKLLRWQLSGELSQHLATLSEQALLLEAEREQLQQLQAMVRHADAAFAQGELTRTDKLQLENAVIASQARLAVIEVQQQQAILAWQQFSGHSAWPAAWPLPRLDRMQPMDWNQHPVLQLQHLDTVIAERTYVRDSDGAANPWQAGVVLRQTRGGAQLPDETAIGLQFSLPVGSSAGTEQSAIAQSAMHHQQLKLAETLRQIRQQWFDAKAQYQATALQLEAINQQLQQSKQIQQAADAALKAGEMTSSDWLRLFLQHTDLKKSAAVTTARLQLAGTQFDQAGGLTW